MPREACEPPPRALEGEPFNSTPGQTEPPRAPEGRRKLRTESPERPPLATKRQSIRRSPRAAPRGAPSPPKPLLAAEPRPPPKQLSTKDKSNTIAFTCGLRRAGEAGPRRADRCNGLLDRRRSCHPVASNVCRESATDLAFVATRAPPPTAFGWTPLREDDARRLRGAAFGPPPQLVSTPNARTASM